MFNDRLVSYSTLFTFWLGGTPVLLAPFPLSPGYIMFIQPACPLNNIILSLVVELLTDQIQTLITLTKIGSHISQILNIVELVKSIVAIRSVLRSFSQLASTARGSQLGSYNG